MVYDYRCPSFIFAQGLSYSLSIPLYFIFMHMNKDYFFSLSKRPMYQKRFWESEIAKDYSQSRQYFAGYEQSKKS